MSPDTEDKLGMYLFLAIWPLIGLLLIYVAHPNPQITVKLFENEALGYTGLLLLVAFFIGLGYYLGERRKK